MNTCEKYRNISSYREMKSFKHQIPRKSQHKSRDSMTSHDYHETPRHQQTPIKGSHQQVFERNLPKITIQLYLKKCFFLNVEALGKP